MTRKKNVRIPKDWPRCPICGEDVPLVKIDDLWWRCPMCGRRMIVHRVAEK